LPKFYANVVNEKRDAQKGNEPNLYGDYENAKIAFGFQDDYEFISKLGRGRYSEVFQAVNLVNN